MSVELQPAWHHVGCIRFQSFEFVEGVMVDVIQQILESHHVPYPTA